MPQVYAYTIHGRVSSEAQDQHRIAKGVEPVALLHGQFVQPANLVNARERHDERQQRRSRQVKVRQEHVDAPELEARHDEQLSPAGQRPSVRNRLERPHRRRPNREHPFCGANPLPGSRLDLVLLPVNDMFLEP